MNLLEYQSIIDKQALMREGTGGEGDLKAKISDRNKQISDLLEQIAVRIRF